MQVRIAISGVAHKTVQMHDHQVAQVIRATRAAAA
jgi:hypothetical protein